MGRLGLSQKNTLSDAGAIDELLCTTPYYPMIDVPHVREPRVTVSSHHCRPPRPPCSERTMNCNLVGSYRTVIPESRADNAVSNVRSTEHIGFRERVAHSYVPRSAEPASRCRNGAQNPIIYQRTSNLEFCQPSCMSPVCAQWSIERRQIQSRGD